MLILALLLFKAVPLYVLDEVDAALDLSHTQNIGRMIKAHFPHSQFILVSLKEGMFNHANDLFRTELVGWSFNSRKDSNKEDQVIYLIPQSNHILITLNVTCLYFLLGMLTSRINERIHKLVV